MAKSAWAGNRPVTFFKKTGITKDYVRTDSVEIQEVASINKLISQIETMKAVKPDLAKLDSADKTLVDLKAKIMNAIRPEADVLQKNEQSHSLEEKNDIQAAEAGYSTGPK